MQILDCTDVKCPLPLLKLKVALSSASHGEFIRLITTDPISLRDIPAFCNRSGHRLVTKTAGLKTEFLIEANNSLRNRLK